MNYSKLIQTRKIGGKADGVPINVDEVELLTKATILNLGMNIKNTDDLDYP